MKRNFLIFICIVPLHIMAQFQIWQGGKVIYEKPMAEIDSLTFGEQNRTPDQERNLDYLFDINSLPEVKISVTLRDWNKFLSNYQQDPNNDLYVPAQFDLSKDGTVWHRDSIGLRPRGNTSRRCAEQNSTHSKYSSWIPAHFGVKFTEYTTGERFFGVDRLIFKFFKDDPNFCREIYCYDLFHRFNVWSAPRASYCRFSVYVEGDNKPVYLGIYAMIENPRHGWVDDNYKQGHLPNNADNEGNMWKAAYRDSKADLSYAEQYLMSLEDNTYTLKTNKTELAAAQQELLNFINGLRQNQSGSAALKTWLTENMDVDLFLRAYAVNVVVGMWDDYWINGNNYFFYFDQSHRFYFIPFDYDNTLGTSSLIGNSGTQNPLYWGNRSQDGQLLIERVLSISEFENQYKAYLLELVNSDDLFAPTGSIARIQKWQNMINPYIANDTRTDDFMSRHYISDEPAYWGNCGFYRLLTGNDGGGNNGDANFFKTKQKIVRQYCQ